MNDPGFLDFHVIVNKVADDDGDSFIVVVGEAPISRSGYRFDRVARGESLERALTRLAAASLVRDLDGNFRLHWSGNGKPSEDREIQPVQRPTPRGRELAEVGRTLFWLLFP